MSFGKWYSMLWRGLTFAVSLSYSWLLLMPFSNLLRLRYRLIIPLISLSLLSPLIYHLIVIDPHNRQNFLQHHIPSVLHPLITWVVTISPNDAPSLIPELLSARWCGSWLIPILSPPTFIYEQDREIITSPVVLMLHVFSTSSTRSRERRQLLREAGVYDVTRAYRHLLEVKFILGRPLPPLSASEEAEEDEIAMETAKYGDIVRLDGLVGGENMNRGKTWSWIRHVGREGGRQAWWVIKCDDDVSGLIRDGFSLDKMG